MKEEKYLYKELSFSIVGAAYDAYNQLGVGFKEKHYQKAMAELLKTRNINFREQVPWEIKINDKIIGRYFFDLLIENSIVVELKKGDYYVRGNIDQVKSYLSATGLKLAILINFTSKGVKFLRIINIIAPAK
ncbi:MAG: GxxExxY protein [Candidatus Falkowbacteria bacterium]